MKKLYACFIIIISFLLFSLQVQAIDLKLAVVRLQDVINESNVGKRSKKILKERFSKRENQLKKQDSQIKKLQQELQQATLLNQTAKLEKQKNILELQKKFIQDRQAFLADVREAEQSYTDNILKELKDLIEKLGKKQKYDFIFEQNYNSVLLFSKSTVADITEEVIKEYNKL